MDNDLFGDFAVALLPSQVSTSSANSGMEREVTKLWETWVELTHRPDRLKTNREFAKVCRELLRSHFPVAKMYEIINGAARLQPRGNDANDIKRVTAALTSSNKTRLALAALLEQREIVFFPRPDIVQKCSLADLEDALGSTARDWIDGDQEAAGVLMDRYDAEQMVELAEHAMRVLAEPYVLPHEVLRYAKDAKSMRVGKRSDRDNYGAGRIEADALRGVSMTADPAARKMLQRGSGAKQVSAFHFQAPDGYWDRVLDILEDEPDASHEEIYGSLSAEFQNWHPSNRS